MRAEVKTPIVAKVIAIIGLMALNAFVMPRPASAFDDDKHYCQKNKDGLWECTAECPPLGCNCECATNCLGAIC